jgi:putative ABC transport system ATP-binding protein
MSETKQVAPASSSEPLADDPNERPVIVRTVQLRKIYLRGTTETHALAGIDYVIHRGDFICIMGPSGSGKSTFFNIVGGLDSPTSGRVFIDEVDVAQLDAHELAYLRCRKIGYVFQTYNLIGQMTALENVTTPMAFAGLTADERRERGMSLLELVGLRERWAHRPVEMSGGQQQRVAIARSMANNPSLLLCDEPTANLDLKTGKEILRILRQLRDERKVTVICVTHDHKFLSACDRMLWIRDGKIERSALRSEIEVQEAELGGLGDVTGAPSQRMGARK